MFLGRERADEAQVRTRARLATTNGKPASAVLAADGRARHEAVVRALEILRSEHVAKIAIVVRSDSSSPVTPSPDMKGSR
jgi:biopolymer transport protein ExbD